MLAGLVLGIMLGLVLGAFWGLPEPVAASKQYEIDQKRLAERFAYLTNRASDEDSLHHARKICRGVGYPLRLEGIGFACVDIEAVRWVYTGRAVELTSLVADPAEVADPTAPLP